MIAPIILFASSGFGIALLLGVKMYQQSAGVTLPLASKRTFVETNIRRVERTVKKWGSVSKNALQPLALEKHALTFGQRLHWLFVELKNALTAPGHWLDRRTRNLVSLVRGRQQLSQRNQPSSYMQQISRF